MLTGFESIVEERILKAQKNGELDNLPGKGKPLNLDDMNIPEEFRMAHRVLKNSGFLPPEVEVRKQIKQLEDMLAEIEYKADAKPDEFTEADYKNREAIRKKLDFLMLKINTSRGNSSCSYIPEPYKKRLLNKISSYKIRF